MTQIQGRPIDELLDAAQPARSLMRLLGRDRWRMIASLAIFPIKDCPQWMYPLIIAKIIDLVVAHGPLWQLWIWGAVGFIVFVQNYPMHVLWTRLFMRSVRQIGADLRNALTQRLQALSIGFHTRTSAGVVQTKLIRDVENVELLLQQVPHVVMAQSMVIVGAIVVTALTAPYFLPVFALSVPIAILLRQALTRRSRRHNEEFRSEVEALSSRVNEMAMLIPVTRAHGLESTAERRVAERAVAVRDSGFRLDMLQGRFQSLSWIIFSVLSVACVVVAGAISISGLAPISAGQVVQLSSYFGLITGGITVMLAQLPIAAKGFESVRSIAGVLAEADLEGNAGKQQVESVLGDLTFDRVGFTFGDSDAPALVDIDLAVTAGETVAFVGSSGSGKSTLLNLALGFLRPTEGRILLDGVDAATLDLRTFRRFVSVVPQESLLFEGTIRENVTYGMPQVDDGVVTQALIDSNCAEFVGALPDGWNTIVGPRGARLSGGQRQRIAIARALIRNPKVLLLDEATSALDSRSEALIQESLERLMAGRTTLVVAHRLSTIENADRIVVLEHGRIVEVGDHASLLAAGGRYSQLHGSQVPVGADED